VAPKPDDTVCDPACGTGGFFLAVHRYLKDRNNLRLLLSDWDMCVIICSLESRSCRRPQGSVL
jgi:hypothetical protein